MLNLEQLISDESCFYQWCLRCFYNFLKSLDIIVVDLWDRNISVALKMPKCIVASSLLQEEVWNHHLCSELIDWINRCRVGKCVWKMTFFFFVIRFLGDLIPCTTIETRQVVYVSLLTLDLNLTEHLWRDLEVALHPHSPKQPDWAWRSTFFFYFQ